MDGVVLDGGRSDCTGKSWWGVLFENRPVTTNSSRFCCGHPLQLWAVLNESLRDLFLGN